MRSVSVVVNTFNRADSLAVTLQALEWLDYPSFEVIVVNGPSTDHTDAVLARVADRVKVGHCANRNLSESRNIGVRLARGDIVAFLDDDAYPDPAWLDRLAAAYDWDEVAAAGGPVFGHTGAAYQVLYSRADRFGNSFPDYPPSHNPTQLLASPGSRQFVYTIGTNSSFRRDRLVEMGGFDEEFEYYLEETDVCCRLVDRGYVVVAGDDGYVYHKVLPSTIRLKRDVVKDWYQVMKSRFYFSLKHGLVSSSFAEVCAQSAEFVDFIRQNMELNVEAGVLDQATGLKFERDVAQASDVALERHFAGESKERAPAWFDEADESFLPFPARRPAGGKLHLCLLTQEYPPVPLNGIGRVVHRLAHGLAERGHVVRVLTRGEGHDRVDFEDGVWVHRVVATPHAVPDGLAVPAHIWDYTASMLDEVSRMHAIRPVDLVQSPNWDAEGLAVMLDGRLPLVVGIYTPVKTLLSTDPGLQAAVAAGDTLVPTLIELERLAYEQAPAFLACGPAIVDRVEKEYGVRIDERRLGYVAHGLPDLAAGTDARGRSGTVEPAAGATPELLFVGRLEARKGIDTLLAAVPLLAERGLRFTLTVVGDDTLVSGTGGTFRQAFEAARPELADRVRFVGRVDDDELARRYAACDVFVAPSRFESFGLMLVEAMMFAKPVVCADVGGMAEIVDDGVTGLLVPPGDPVALADALAALLGSPERRRKMGRRGRRRYEQEFDDERMVRGAEGYYRAVIARLAPAGSPA